MDWNNKKERMTKTSKTVISLEKMDQAGVSPRRLFQASTLNTTMPLPRYHRMAKRFFSIMKKAMAIFIHPHMKAGLGRKQNP
jgi:hypothetical protein